MAGEFIQRSRHGTVFYFRRRVPRDLRGKLRRTHLYLSLRTEQLAEARNRARALAVATDRLFLRLRYAEGVENKFRENPSGSVGPTNNGLATNDATFADMQTSTDGLALGYGITFEFDARGNPRINITDAKPGEEGAIADVASRFLGLAKPSTAPEGTCPSPTIAEAIQTILASPDIKGTTKLQYKRAFGYFGKYFGASTPLAEVRAEQFAAFADHVRAQQTWSPKTQAIYITTAQRLFTFFASRSSSVPRISTVGLKPKRSTPQGHDRDAFSLEQLEAIFRHAMTYRQSEPAKWWATVATAFLGTRIEELSQAHLDGDFGFDRKAGIHFLHVDEIARGRCAYPKSVKTKAGWRRVPIHPALEQAGFLEYIERERSAGAQTPFERCWKAQVRKDGGMKHSQYVAKWGGGQMKALRVMGCAGPKASYFHSMRHTFVTLLGKADIGEEWRAALCGQQYGGVNVAVYNKAKDDVSLALPKLVVGLSELDAMFKRVCDGERYAKLPRDSGQFP